MCLLAVERLGLAEVGEVLVVGKDLHRERGAMEVMAPGLQGANDSEEFVIIDIVVTLSRGEGLREVGAGVPIAIGVGLEKDGATRLEARAVVRDRKSVV